MSPIKQLRHALSVVTHQKIVHSRLDARSARLFVAIALMVELGLIDRVLDVQCTGVEVTGWVLIVLLRSAMIVAYAVDAVQYVRMVVDGLLNAQGVAVQSGCLAIAARHSDLLVDQVVLARHVQC